MALRRLVLLLLAVNLAWLAWAQGWLLPWGLGPEPQAEPQRLARQLQPQALRILTPAEAARLAEISASAPARVCLSTPPLDEATRRETSALGSSAASLSAWAKRQSPRRTAT